MNGLSEAITTKVSVRIAGRDFVIDPLLLEDFAAVEAEIAASRPDIVRQTIDATKDAPDAVKEYAIAVAIEKAQKSGRVSEQEVMAHLLTNDGFAFVLHRSLHRNGYNLDRSAIWRWILTAKDEAAEVLRRIFAASGLTSAPITPGNGERPAAETATTPAGQNAANMSDRPTGNSSSSGSAPQSSSVGSVSRRQKQRS